MSYQYGRRKATAKLNRCLLPAVAEAAVIIGTLYTTIHGGHIVDTHTYIHKNSNFLIVTISVGLTQAHPN